MLDSIFLYLQYDFIRNALIVGGLVSLCAALLGVSLVLKRFSMLGDGLSHVSFGALAISTVLGFAPLAFSVPIVILAAFFLLRLNENSRIGGDAAIAMISSGSLAVGVIAVSVTTGMNTDITSYMFGSLNAMEKGDVLLSILLSTAVILLYLLFFNRIFAVTFDESFSKASGMKTGLYNMLIAMVTAITIVVGMRVMGAMLISALIIFPALSSMQFFKSFRAVVISAGVIALICSFVGIMASCLLTLPTGASIVAANAIVFILLSLLRIALGRR